MDGVGCGLVWGSQQLAFVMGIAHGSRMRASRCGLAAQTLSTRAVGAVAAGTLEVLSEQELLDCDTVHDHGCHGGLMDTAFSFVIDNGGIDTERDYRYHAREGNCSVNRENREVVTIDSYVDSASPLSPLLGPSRSLTR